MAEEPDTIVLNLLRRKDAKLHRAVEDVRDVKVRLTSLEEGLAGVNRRIDRIERRVESIEHRLDFVEDSRSARGLGLTFATRTFG